MKSEFQLIERLKKRAFNAGRTGTSVKVGIGDDCAVLPKDGKTDLVITADLMVEEVDFRLGWMNPEFLGHKALAVSLSDVAAMGAKPVWAMLSIGVPEKVWKSDFVDQFYTGWFALAEQYQLELVGGDISKTPDKIVIDSIVCGETKSGKAVLRSGAKPGDSIFVTGKLGGAAAGLKLLEEGERFEKSPAIAVKNLLLRQLKPEPRVEVGLILSEKKLAAAMIDLSDGLSSDLTHLCRESRVGAKIFAHKIPVNENLENFLTRKAADPRKENLIHSNIFSDSLSFALDGGEDFELLFTVSKKKISRLEKELKNHAFFHIGEVTANAELIELSENRKSVNLEPKGFRHF